MDTWREKMALVSECKREYPPRWDHFPFLEFEPTSIKKWGVLFSMRGRPSLSGKRASSLWEQGTGGGGGAGRGVSAQKSVTGGIRESERKKKQKSCREGKCAGGEECSQCYHLPAEELHGCFLPPGLFDYTASKWKTRRPRWLVSGPHSISVLCSPTRSPRQMSRFARNFLVFFYSSPIEFLDFPTAGCRGDAGRHFFFFL